MTLQLSPGRVGLPPPAKLDLIDAGVPVGWIAGDSVGFRGFANEVEATHAAWVAYRTLARHLARAHGTRPVPIDTEPLALQRRGEAEMILASGRPIAALIRPDAESPTGPDSFGFELLVPSPTTELRVRAMAYLMYLSLRKSGLRWALWRRDAGRADSALERVSTSRPDVDHTREAANNVNRGEHHAAERLHRRAWKLPFLPWRRAGRLGRA